MLKKTIRMACLAGVAALAVMAVAAPGLASAAEPEFQAETFPVRLEGSGTQSFVTNAGVFTCSTSKQSGEPSSKATWWSVKVADSGCTIGGELAEVKWGNCEIRYYTYSGYYITCKGELVKVTVPKSGCVVEIGAQEVSSVSFSASGSGASRAITAKVQVTAVKYTQNSKCAGGAGTFTNGEIGGEIALKGFSGEKQQGIFIK